MILKEITINMLGEIKIRKHEEIIIMILKEMSIMILEEINIRKREEKPSRIF